MKPSIVIFILFLIKSAFSIKSDYTLKAGSKVKSLKLTSDNELASGTFAGSIDLWNLTAKAKSNTLKANENDITDEALLIGHDRRKAIIFIDFVKNHKTLISVSDDETIKLWNASFSTVKITLTKYGPIKSLVFLSDDSLFTAFADNTIAFWNGKTDQVAKTFEFKGVTCLTMLSDDKLVAGTNQGNLAIWNAKTFETIVKSTNLLRSELIFVLKLNTNNLVAGFKNGIILICDLTDSVVITKSLKIDKDNSLTSLVVLDKNKLVSGYSDGTIVIWDTFTGGNYVVNEHSDSVNSLLLHSTTSFFSGSTDGTIKFWSNIEKLDYYLAATSFRYDLKDKSTCLRTLTAESEIISMKLINEDLLATGTNDGFIKLWNLNTGGMIKTSNEMRASAAAKSINTLEIFDDTLLSGSDDRHIKRWIIKPNKFEIITGELIDTFVEGVGGQVKQIRKLSNNLVATCSSKLTIKNLTAQFIGVNGTAIINEETLLKERKRVYDYNKRIKDFNDAAILYDIIGMPTCMQVYADDTILIGTGKMIHFVKWNQLVMSITGEKVINCLAILSDDKVASGDRDGRVAIYERNRGKLILSIVEKPVIVKKTKKQQQQQRKKEQDIVYKQEQPFPFSITCLLALDRDTLAGGHLNGDITLWNIGNGTIKRRFVKAHSEPVTSLELLKNKIFISASKDKTIKFWLD